MNKFLHNKIYHWCTNCSHNLRNRFISSKVNILTFPPDIINFPIIVKTHKNINISTALHFFTKRSAIRSFFRILFIVARFIKTCLHNRPIVFLFQIYIFFVWIFSNRTTKSSRKRHIQATKTHQETDFCVIMSLARARPASI